MSSLKKINKERIKWKIDFLQNGLESVEQTLNSDQDLNEAEIEFLNEDSKNIKKWIKDLQVELKEA